MEWTTSAQVSWSRSLLWLWSNNMSVVKPGIHHPKYTVVLPKAPSLLLLDENPWFLAQGRYYLDILILR